MIHTHINKISVLFAIIFMFLLGRADVVEAVKSTTWTSAAIPELNYYYWAWGWWPPTPDPTIHNSDDVPLDTSSDDCIVNGDLGCGWAKGLEAGAVADVTYRARLVNDVTNVEIVDGTTVPVGTRVRVEAMPYDGTDIWWVGTGASYDSPYGRWVAGAGPLALSCNAEDYLNGTTDEVYTLLNVNPPASSLITSTNASCVGNVCTLNTAGASTFNFQFAATKGKFYYRFATGGDCYAFNAPMRSGVVPINNFWGFDGNYCEGHNCLAGPDYELSVPARTISFSLDVVNPSLPPGAPSFTGPITGLVGQTLTYTCNVPSSDTGNARCGVDLDEDGIADTYNPAGLPPFSGIGTDLTFDLSWATAGTYRIQAIAQDDNYQDSAWSTPIDVTITEAPCASATYGLCELPPTSSGSSAAPSCTDAMGVCNYSCSNSVWTQVSNTCVPPTIDTFRVCTQDMLTCANSGGTLDIDVSTPLTIEWDSSNADLCTAVLGTGFGTGNNFDGSDSTGIVANSLPGQTDTYRIACNYNGGTPVESTVYVSTNATLPILTTTQTVVERGDTVRLNWNTNNGNETLCTLEGAGVTTSDLSNGTDGADTGYVDVMVDGRATYTLTCPGGVALKTVEIIPTSWEW